MVCEDRGNIYIQYCVRIHGSVLFIYFFFVIFVGFEEADSSVNFLGIFDRFISNRWRFVFFFSSRDLIEWQEFILGILRNRIYRWVIQYTLTAVIKNFFIVVMQNYYIWHIRDTVE